VLVKQNTNVYIVKTLESLMERLTVLGLNYSVITCWNHRDETVLFFLKYIGGWVGYGVNRHFQQHFSYIVGVSLIGGGNRRKPLTCLKSLTTFISWWPVLSVEETGVPGKHHWPSASHWQTLSHNVVSKTLAWEGIELTTLEMICADCIGTCSCKSNYHTITTTTAPGPSIIHLCI